MKAKAALVTRFPTNNDRTESMITVKGADGALLDILGPMPSPEAFTKACDIALINGCEFTDA